MSPAWNNRCRENCDNCDQKEWLSSAECTTRPLRVHEECKTIAEMCLESKPDCFTCVWWTNCPVRGDSGTYETCTPVPTNYISATRTFKPDKNQYICKELDVNVTKPWPPEHDHFRIGQEVAFFLTKRGAVCFLICEIFRCIGRIFKVLLTRRGV